MKSSDCFYNPIYEVLNNTGEIMSHKTHLIFFAACSLIFHAFDFRAYVCAALFDFVLRIMTLIWNMLVAN